MFISFDIAKGIMVVTHMAVEVAVTAEGKVIKVVPCLANKETF